ncbi:DUF4783 domain-containing protein [Spirosoma endbachense]|uniref:DUF4783 domain-containing protein n=1 Tax=Spirosoma endbachense TaxID=2666025 RepID=A0A6P1VQ66_9BACT|nr:DUF4783 domain-containing protein [Spirosoma endbachense]QHV95223.1 DUF4783 domain-containing protein [Spirosoma endbachense]
MNFLTTIALLLILNTLPEKTATDAEVIQTVQTSLRKGNAGQLSTRFDRTIELVIDAEKVEFPSVQATHAALILRSFFRKYPPHGFQFVYRGASDRLRYSTGTYSTEGRTFAVYVLMHQNADHQYVINALHFRKE